MAKAKQGFIDGMEPEVIPEIEQAAEAYVDVRDSRMAMNKNEVKAKATLQATMDKHKIKRYEYGDKEVVTLRGEAKLKVRTKKVKKVKKPKKKQGKPGTNGEA